MTISFDVSKSFKISGLRIITPSIFEESRGSIWTSYETSNFESLLPKGLFFKHDKFSTSKHNVLRGIHGDGKTWKLVSCVSGSIFQVVVDMRKKSDTFRLWQSFELSPNNRCMILIPPGLGNAFYVRSLEATYHYKLAYHGEYVDADEQFTLAWNDTNLKINWPTNKPLLSSRDMRE